MKKSLFAIMLVFIFAAMAQPVLAIPTLWLSDNGGSTWLTASDNGAGDSNPLDGVVQFSNPMGNWIVNVTTGITNPVLGSATSPHMDLNSVNVNSTSGGTLLIGFSEDGFGPFDGWLQSSVGGVTTGTAEFASGINGLDTLISSFGPFRGAFSGSTSAAASLSSDDILWLGAKITHNSGWGSTSFNYEVKVPEPGMLLLFGSGLVGLAFFRRRKY
jgi:hypothetical protein